MLLIENRIISTLIGLVGACNNNPKTENTDRLVIKALAFSSNAHAADEIVKEIRAEKYRIAPGCMTCAMPCGNTSNYDMERIYSAAEEIRGTKLDILSELAQMAEYILKNEVSLSDDGINFFYKALSYISYDMGKEPLLSLLGEAREMKRTIKKI